MTPNYSVKHQIRRFKFLSRGYYYRYWLRLFPLDKGWQCNAFVKLFRCQSETELQTQSRMGDVSLGQGRIRWWHHLTAQLSGTAGNHRRRRHQLSDWRGANYISSLSLEKEVVPRDLSSKPSANTADVMLHRSFIKRLRLCQKFTLPMFSNYSAQLQ